MGWLQDDREAVKGFPVTEEVQKPGVRSKFRFKSPQRDIWYIWFSGYNRNKPWRTALVVKGEDGIRRFSCHASHETLRGACEFLTHFD